MTGPIEKAVEAASKMMRERRLASVYEEELIALWGRDFYNECITLAKSVRRTTWEFHKSKDPKLEEIDFEPPIDLILAVALRRLLKVSIYNRGDFPAKTEGDESERSDRSV